MLRFHTPRQSISTNCTAIKSLFKPPKRQLWTVTRTKCLSHSSQLKPTVDTSFLPVCSSYLPLNALNQSLKRFSTTSAIRNLEKSHLVRHSLSLTTSNSSICAYSNNLSSCRSFSSSSIHKNQTVDSSSNPNSISNISSISPVQHLPTSVKPVSLF